MNQLVSAEEQETTDLEKLRFLKAHLSEEQMEAYRKDFNNGTKISYHYYNFVPFCHGYAEFLLVSGSFNMYESFIRSFNQLIKNDPTHKLMEEIQTNQFKFPAGLSFLNSNYNQVFIKDRRPLVRDREFADERDLELIIETEFNDFFGEEINIQRQKFHGYGRSDITINNKVTIELKKGSAKRMNVYQAFEYSFDKNLDDVCLLTADFDDKTLSIANKLNVSCYIYSFMYEESIDEYPIGFVIEKVNGTRKNLFDDYLEAMDECFWISFYEPSFKFSDVYDKKIKMVKEISAFTDKIHEENKKQILINLQKQGYDTSSQDLKEIVKQFKDKEVI